MHSQSDLKIEKQSSSVYFAARCEVLLGLFCHSNCI